MADNYVKRSKREEMLDWLMAIEERLHRMIPGRFIHLTYCLGEEYSMSEWQRQYHHVRSGEEYVFVSDNTTGDLLYVVNVSADAVLTAISEVMDLLSRKF